MRTRARPVSSRNCEPVTVVAPPRKWMSIGRIVPRRRVAGIIPGRRAPARHARGAAGSGVRISRAAARTIASIAIAANSSVR